MHKPILLRIILCDFLSPRYIYHVSQKKMGPPKYRYIWCYVTKCFKQSSLYSLCILFPHFLLYDFKLTCKISLKFFCWVVDWQHTKQIQEVVKLHFHWTLCLKSYLQNYSMKWTHFVAVDSWKLRHLHYLNKTTYLIKQPSLEQNLHKDTLFIGACFFPNIVHKLKNASGKKCEY